MQFIRFNTTPRGVIAGIAAILTIAQVASGSVIVTADVVPVIQTYKTVTNPANGHTYHLISGLPTVENPAGGVTWTQADAFAKSISSSENPASLVSISSASEQQWIGQHFPETLLGGAMMHQVIWIGLNDSHEEGSYHWQNGENVHHTNWANNFPNDHDGSEDYVYLTNTSMFNPFVPQGTWNDYQDNPIFGNLPFSAIIEVAPIPEPSTAILMMFSLLGIFRRKR